MFLDHLNFFPIYTKKIYRLRNGTNIETRARTTDLGTLHTCFIGEENRVSEDMLGSSPVIIDIGAHIGIFSVYACKKIPDSKVYSYEPFPDNYELLKRNIEINNLGGNIKAFNSAVFSKKGKKSLYFRKRYTAGCTLMKDTSHADSSAVTVNCTTVKDIFDSNKIKKCDLMKIDCEGADHIILRSIPRQYFKRINMIHTEFHAQNEINAMKKVFDEMNFSTEIKRFAGGYGNIYAKNMN
ncbi:MAG: FkbM family methyltransferase [Candidatus Aenigmarchaeota archaeon]|nr:FkbM family methyltransferase [Candidatus Aenigmarchaeota archaeon]